MQVTTVGLDLAKDVFQVHGVTADGTVLFNRSVSEDVRPKHLQAGANGFASAGFQKPAIAVFEHLNVPISQTI